MRRHDLNGIELWEAPETAWSGAPCLVGQQEALVLCRIATGLAAGGFRGPRRGDRSRFVPVLLGPPGTGKTTLAYQVAREAAHGRGVFTVHCNSDMTAEDLVATPVAGAGGGVRFQLSPFATAALRGGAVILDEAARLEPSAWASLLGAIDERRTLVSVPAGVALPVREGFTVLLTLGAGADARRLPRAVRSRLGPYVPLRPLTRPENVRLVRRAQGHLPAEAVGEGLDLLAEAVGASGGEPLAPRELLRVFGLYERLSRAWPGGAAPRVLGSRCLKLVRPPAARRGSIPPVLPEEPPDDLPDDLTDDGSPASDPAEVTPQGLVLRMRALEHFERGDYADAESALRQLLRQGFEPAGTRCHLARVLLVTGREEEAHRLAVEAWDHRGDAAAHVPPRILWLRTAFTLLAGEDAAPYLREFLEAMQEPLAAVLWLTAQMLERLRPRLAAEGYALLEAMAAAASGATPLEALGELPAWQEAVVEPGQVLRSGGVP